jgi:hypothetical protein
LALATIAMACPRCGRQTCSGVPQCVTIQQAPQTFQVPVTRTIMEPQTVMVPQTRLVPRTFTEMQTVSVCPQTTCPPCRQGFIQRNRLRRYERLGGLLGAGCAGVFATSFATGCAGAVDSGTMYAQPMPPGMPGSANMQQQQAPPQDQYQAPNTQQPPPAPPAQSPMPPTPDLN